MAMQLLDRTPWISAWISDDGRTAAGPAPTVGRPAHGSPDRDGFGPHCSPRSDPCGELATFLDRRWRLPTCARTYAFHGLSALGAVEQQLVHTLRPLQGKFTVVNHSVVVPLPVAARRRAGRLLAAALDRARRHGLAVAVALSEEQRPVVRHEVKGSGAAGDPGPDVRFAADLRYLLAVALGDRQPRRGRAAGDDPALPDVRRVSRPFPWFDLPVLVPDADALRLMAPDTQQLYRSITGRAGPGSHDRYWYAESWERYHEPGRMAGCIQPAAVEYATGRATGPAIPHRAEPEDDFLYGSSAGEHSQWADYSPCTQSRLFVPPGYCLIRFACWAEVGLAEVATAGVESGA